MSSRWHQKLNLLIEFWNSIFIKFLFKAYKKIGLLWTCIQNQLACYFSSILSYCLPSARVPPWTCCEVYSTLPDPHLHCRTNLWLFFEKFNIQKLNLLSKTDISKTAWINPWMKIRDLEFSSIHQVLLFRRICYKVYLKEHFVCSWTVLRKYNISLDLQVEDFEFILFLVNTQPSTLTPDLIVYHLMLILTASCLCCWYNVLNKKEIYGYKPRGVHWWDTGVPVCNSFERMYSQPEKSLMHHLFAWNKWCI